MIENFGPNVLRLRKELGLSQDELAKRIDVNRQTISKIERGAGYPTFETLEKIAQLFNATPTQLFGTPKEIAISDTPIILDRIDEYDKKIQSVLRAEKFINEVQADQEYFFKNDTIQAIFDLGYYIEIINKYLSEPFKFNAEDIYNNPDNQAIFELADAIDKIKENNKNK
ncbi:helix-turn-helix transcriptional regulator [Enterococcus thailandicus]|uniref:helix-turn-helix domain-containing protein n=1 Tax=Enterococcus thailandicus TaxID=417368 RepID=UPI0032E4FD09